MSFIVGDEIITEEIPVEIEPILFKLKENTKIKTRELMKTIAHNDRYIAYVIPEAGMVVFADEIKEDNKIFRLLVSHNGALYIDNKQRRGGMLCPLFSTLEDQIKDMAGKQATTVPDDKEYRIYESFMPKIVETINEIFSKQPEAFKH